MMVKSYNTSCLLLAALAVVSFSGSAAKAQTSIVSSQCTPLAENDKFFEFECVVLSESTASANFTTERTTLKLAATGDCELLPNTAVISMVSVNNEGNVLLEQPGSSQHNLSKDSHLVEGQYWVEATKDRSSTGSAQLVARKRCPKNPQ